MTKEKVTTQITTPMMPSLSTINYDAMQYLNWLNADVQSVQSIGYSVFRGSMSGDTTDIKNALSKALDEVQDDITNLKAFLNTAN